MTPKEKAYEIFEKFWLLDCTTEEIAKQCALICIDRIIIDGNLEFMTIQESLKPRLYEYWVEVRKEIELL